MKKATLCFLVKGDEVLLAMKKRGFGVGLWNGAGGKVVPGERVREAAIREVKEEIGVTISKLKKMAVINFLFPQKPEWSQIVTVYVTGQWEGTPKETDEMKPRWFVIKKLPFKKMWWDDKYWLPKILEGKCVNAKFVFDNHQKLVRHHVEIQSPKG